MERQKGETEEHMGTDDKEGPREIESKGEIAPG